MTDKENTNQQSSGSDNSYYTTATALQIRLNVEPLITQLEMDIRGLRQEWDETTQTVKIRQIGEPLFTKETGIQAYLSFIRSIVNTQIVQGNFNEDTYADYLERIRKGLATDLMINRHKYGLPIYHYEGVISLAMNTIEGFLTRPIGDKERQSYANTFKTVESSQTVAGRTGGLFNFKN